MKKPLARKCSQEVWFGILVSFIMCLVLLCFDFSAFLDINYGVSIWANRKVHPIVGIVKINQTKDSCSGRYIYIHVGRPSKFNYDFLIDIGKSITSGNRSSSISTRPKLVNFAIGPEIKNPEGVLANKSWYKASPYSLHVIFHSKMKMYECLTSNSALASAICVPYYAGMDIGYPQMSVPNLTVRDSSAKDFVKWLLRQREWRKMWGRDHFFAAGRPAWEFWRKTNNSSDWDTKLKLLPEYLNMTMFSIEGSACWIHPI